VVGRYMWERRNLFQAQLRSIDDTFAEAIATLSKTAGSAGTSLPLYEPLLYRLLANVYLVPCTNYFGAHRNYNYLLYLSI
jgi:hypothetical protein